MLGIAPSRGRELQPGEARPDRTLVLTHRFWMRKFGGDVALAASYAPARRAMRVDPRTALRAE